MGAPNSDQRRPDNLLKGFSPTSPTRIHWNSRKRSANGENTEKACEENPEDPMDSEDPPAPKSSQQDPSFLSDRRKALFEPLEPTGRRISAEMLLPPPDFDAATYPKGWLVGKKRKLVNVDVVESMRRIAVQEMNRKDKEIDGLNEQLEEDARCVEHLQLQLLQERSKRADVERENALLQNQISLLMSMLPDNDGEEDAPPDDS